MELFKLWSLLDMLRLNLKDLFDSVLWLRDKIEELETKDPREEVSKEDRTQIWGNLLKIYNQIGSSERSGLSILSAESGYRLANMVSRLIEEGVYNHKSLRLELEEIEELILDTLGENTFSYIPSPNNKYFDKNALFGEGVYNVFAEARDEIKDAGNCLASELYTASVFHLMRVTELALRRLAGKLQVQLTHRGADHPIEYADWNKVIEGGCKPKIELLRKNNPGPQKEEKLKQLSDAVDRCTYIRDIWRNNVSHTRARYTSNEAIAILSRVEGFMQSLVSIV